MGQAKFQTLIDYYLGDMHRAVLAPKVHPHPLSTLGAFRKGVARDNSYARSGGVL